MEKGVLEGFHREKSRNQKDREKGRIFGEAKSLKVPRLSWPDTFWDVWPNV